jgi:DNA-binding HxlR family transcriptional regulator
VPPRVEYEITPSAQALKPVFDELFKWSQEHGFPTKGQPKAEPGSEKNDSGRETLPLARTRRP